MSTTQTEVRCGKKIGRGSCRNDALSMVNGEPRCVEHTPQASAEFDVMPLHTPDVTDLPMCSCGCGVQVRRKSRTYLQGHDQRHKGQLLRAFDKGTAEAGDELIKRGWKSDAELADRKLVADAKAAKKAAKAEAEPLAVEAEPEAEQPTAPRVSRGRSRRAEPQASASA